MRLLNTQTWEMKEFISEDQVPPYAILSHTWDDEEVTFQQWEARAQADITHLQGYKKIKTFCIKAAENGFQWVWIDTCCIDKKSSAELSEAINSMFRWYHKAQICYAFLSDVFTKDQVGLLVMEAMRQSRWFTRGWTLQELIAPVAVDFYSAEWHLIGPKATMYGHLCEITGIEMGVLTGFTRLEDVSIAKRMSWASGRKTSRVEDVAYSLLGLFDVNMPLIYGEGHKAFRRLQEAIMNSTNDQSLFAWGRVIEKPGELIDRQQASGAQPIPWVAPHERLPLLGLFASSPADFKHSGAISPIEHSYTHHHYRRNPPVIINKGALISFVIFQNLSSVSYWDEPRITQPTERELALLLCEQEQPQGGSRVVALVLHPWGDDYYSRTDELVLVKTHYSHVFFENRSHQRHILPFQPFDLLKADILLRQWRASKELDWRRSSHTRSGPAWDLMWGGKVLRIRRDATGFEEESFMYRTGENEGFALTFKRIPPKHGAWWSDMGVFVVGVSAFVARRGGKGWSEIPGDSTDTWVASHGRPFHEPDFSHAMKLPSDTWSFNIQGIPRIHVKVTRQAFEVPGAIDVVDLWME